MLYLRRMDDANNSRFVSYEINFKSSVMKSNIGVAISYKKFIPRKQNIWNNWFFRLFRGTKIEANFRNFVLKHFAEENTLSILFAERIRKLSFLITFSKRGSQILKIMSAKTKFEVRTCRRTNFVHVILFCSELRN
jgi:hypothetical protein